MDSANNSSSLQSSSGGGGGGGGGGEVEEFDSRTFFATATGINNTSVTNTNSSRRSSGGGNNHLHFFDSLSFLDPSPSFPFLPNPPAKTPAPAPKNSRKRSRASRRAPTTVLTTDTSNFRAMVQEFTGIPAPPFSSTGPTLSSSYPRSRFDFFNPTINASSSSPSSSFLLKPYPQKFQVPNNINASSVTNGSGSINNNNSNNNSVIANPTGFNYQSPILNFQSLLQSQLAASSTADLGVKAQQQQQQQQPVMMPSTSASAEYGVADLGLSGLIGAGWGQDAGNDPTQLRQDVSNSCKLNFSAAVGTAEFGGADKGGEPRGEGMVESWICSSD